MTDLRIVFAKSLFVFLCCTLSKVSSDDLKVLTIGSYSPLSGPCWDGGFAVKLVMDLALKQINNRKDVLPGYRLEMVLNDTKCDPGVGMHMLYDHIYKEPNKIMLLGAAFSPVSQPIAETAKFWNLVQVSYASTSPALSNRELYPRFFRTISSDLAFNPARAALLSKYDWKRVATLHQNEPSGIFSQPTKELHKLLAKMKVEVVAGESFTGRPARQLANIMEKGARIIIGSFYESGARQVFCEAYKKQMFGERFVWIIIGWYDDNWWKKRLDEENVDCSPSEMSQAVEGYLATDHVKLNEDDITSQNKTISGWTAQQYANKFKNLTNISAVHESSFAYDATWAIALALNKSIQRLADRGKFLENFTYTDKEMADVVQEALKNTSFLGVTGPVSFTENGERIGYIQIEQLQGVESKRVAVYDPATDSVIMNKKEPIRWQGSGPPRDRTITSEKLKFISRALYGFMATLAVLGIFLGLVFLLINFWYRERRIIKMSSPRLNNAIVVGCMMTYFSVILFGLDGGLISTEEYGKVCIARAWVMSIGFTLAFGAMFAKTWRVHAIFKSITPKKKVIRDEHLFLIVGAIVLLDILLLSLWSGIEPMHTGYQRFIDEMRLEDDTEIIPKLEHCESKNLSYWLGAVYAFKGLLLVFGVFLAWETRAVTIPALNDSRYIGMSVYNVVILSILGVAITSVIRDHQDATFAITAVFIIFCTTLTLCFVFVPKVIQLCSPDGGNEASNTRKSTANNPDSLSTMDKNAVNMTTENSKLKKQLAEREQHFMDLKRLLETVAPDLIDDKEKKFKKRQSLVTFRKPEPSYTNDNYESDERISSDKGSGKKTTNSSDSGVKI